MRADCCRPRPRAPLVTLVLGLGATLLPKCPLCLAAYLSVVGLGAAAPVVAPLGVALVFLSIAYLALRRSRTHCASTEVVPIDHGVGRVSTRNIR